MSEVDATPAPRLKVLVTNPYAWPHVRRGAERLLNDLAGYLHAAGHDVSVAAMAPQDGRELRDGVHYRFLRERGRSRLRQFNSLHRFAWQLQSVVRELDPDVVFCLNYFDAYAAVRCRERHQLSFRIVFQNVGIPVRRYFTAVPLDRWFMHRVLQEADDCLVLSRFAQERLEQEFGRSAQLLPPPVQVRAFRVDSAKPEGAGPLILFAGDVDEPRKGANVLCRAFAHLRQSMPGLRLRFVGKASAATRRALLAQPGVEDARAGVEFCGVGDVASLPRHYREASVTALPALWEAFGLVLVESLASGTPVVGARHGGISDIVQGDLVGRLFDPGPPAAQSQAVGALAEALREVLERGKSAEVSAACRARAHCFSWDTLGPAYLALARPRREPARPAAPEPFAGR